MEHIIVLQIDAYTVVLIHCKSTHGAMAGSFSCSAIAVEQRHD